MTYRDVPSFQRKKVVLIKFSRFTIEDRVVKHHAKGVNLESESLLDDIIRIIKNPEVLYVGRELSNFHLRPREILVNWLICVVGNSEGDAGDWTFAEDPMGGDGLLVDRLTDKAWPTEHVFIRAPEPSNDDSAENLMVKAVEHKQKNGPAYAKGKYLVIFADDITDSINGRWHPDKVSERIDGRHDFRSVWAVGLERVEQNEYKYWIVCLDERPCPIYIVSVDVETAEWSVGRIQ